MSATIGVEGLKSKTEEYEKKLQIYKLCEELLIEPPAEIIKFFHGRMCEDGVPVREPESRPRQSGRSIAPKTLSQEARQERLLRTENPQRKGLRRYSNCTLNWRKDCTERTLRIYSSALLKTRS